MLLRVALAIEVNPAIVVAVPPNDIEVLPIVNEPVDDAKLRLPLPSVVKKLLLARISPALIFALPDMANEVAVTAPVIVALVAVRFPARSTLKGAEEKELLPRCMPSAVLIATLVEPAPAVKDVDPRVNPPIVPDVEVTEPVIVALLAVRAPAGVTLKGALPKVAWPSCMPEPLALKIELPEPMLMFTPESVPPDAMSPAVRAPLRVRPLL